MVLCTWWNLPRALLRTVSLSPKQKMTVAINFGLVASRPSKIFSQESTVPMPNSYDVQKGKEEKSLIEKGNACI